MFWLWRMYNKNDKKYFGASLTVWAWAIGSLIGVIYAVSQQTAPKPAFEPTAPTATAPVQATAPAQALPELDLSAGFPGTNAPAEALPILDLSRSQPLPGKPAFTPNAPMQRVSTPKPSPAPKPAPQQVLVVRPESPKPTETPITTNANFSIRVDKTHVVERYFYAKVHGAINGQDYFWMLSCLRTAQDCKQLQVGDRFTTKIMAKDDPDAYTGEDLINLRVTGEDESLVYAIVPIQLWNADFKAWMDLK